MTDIKKLKYQKIGDILIVKNDLNESEIKELVKRTNCKTILKYETHITGDLRVPTTKILYGTETETINKEHGCLFSIDASKIMWSMGNLEERKRIANKSNSDEIIVDMFAGIGYFTIPLAKYSKPKKIYALELNPNSYHYLCKNVKLNKVEDIVVPINLDNRNFHFHKNNNNNNIKADRILMGYVVKTNEFLEKAFQLLGNNGTIHYHDTVPEKLIESRPIEQLKSIGSIYGFELQKYEIVRIKKYSPGVWHIVVDAKFKKIDIV
ncbi:tRNA(Phe) (4-demethylwyosine(37)-C(7)) aminocarboxypropyltransferase Taw2 [Methanococcus voltae]|uniref:tRNA(Phe) (4-demethylwyosine(37)-C(7)) aminocarboxypropyltransferase n=2 Tax=Methanococcus voltae TaxID=2188 RepID=A0A8J7USQ4_METVO|nr:class I SAM-dependent methyltransferase family protein [Methanococcus voltae]MBP2173047.1 tRNA wybutosine-synthesizing protein 2 [Methanococcus voltae]MBP2201897.1 tRNA wybutosine-synthesizing protein 2 [Methanococcus voltae]MCS3922061.1 tRNA wybutosine-synthesizing protein 2 [Methanococcus voltae PS]